MRRTESTTASATSSGAWPRRNAFTVRSRDAARAPTNRVLSMIGVLMTPGQIAVTPTPDDCQSARRHCESMSTAALVVQ